MGFIPGFASGSSLVIAIDGVTQAYATNLSWSDDVAHAAVGGIGSFSYDALEPLQYLARGSFSLMRYSSEAKSRIEDASLPARSKGALDANNGNSALAANSFNPSMLLLSKTFDIDIYERLTQATAIVFVSAQAAVVETKDTKAKDAVPASGDLVKTFTIKDCRLTSYSITFTPGQLVSENIGFICLQAIDELVQNSNDLEA